MPRGSFNSARFYAITRTRYSWVVRLTRQGQRFEKSFSDRHYGGRPNALVHATDWRDRIVRAHPPQPRREKAMRPKGGNGPMPGVTADIDSHGKIQRWRAKTYVDKGTVLQRTFSATQHGQAAEHLAAQERARQLQQVTGLAWIHPEESQLRLAPSSVAPLPPVPEPIPANQVVRTSNSSGFPGVVRRARHWTAQTTTGGRWVSQSFRIERYGEEVALILAVWARLDQLAAVGTQDNLKAARAQPDA